MTELHLLTAYRCPFSSKPWSHPPKDPVHCGCGTSHERFMPWGKGAIPAIALADLRAELERRIYGERNKQHIMGRHGVGSRIELRPSQTSSALQDFLDSLPKVEDD